MKERFLLFMMLCTFISCQEDVKFNNPSFQGTKDNVFWRAVQSNATIETDGSLTIEAYTSNEKVTLKTTSTAKTTYFLGTSTSKTATYTLTDATGTVTFATGFGIGDGQIIITEYDALNKTISGTFKFNAKNTSNNPLYGPTLNFQYGIFYKVPIISNP
ncbi:MAG: DUF6252 family protein [Flavobacterium sp.]|uniref:DUF6252 family protein n=1 Tax=Flavobacterium sp. TaxID=239 RepID=UPI00262EEB22|nr:DUF6252 family protein [Flavobacterium sp.]MDD5152349.1 DUF6252 family protein [Flavobacterium sp.]